MTPDHTASVAPAGASRILLGGHLAVGSTREWLRAWAAVLILLGPARLILRIATVLPNMLPIRGRAACRAAERWWARLAARLLGLSMHINGLEHIDLDEQYVVVALHEGFADGLAILHLPLSFTVVARDELAAFPVLGGHLKRGRHILIRPERPVSTTRSLLRDARAAIESGESVLLFLRVLSSGSKLHFSLEPSTLAGAPRASDPPGSSHGRAPCLGAPIFTQTSHKPVHEPHRFSTCPA